MDDRLQPAPGRSSPKTGAERRPVQLAVGADHARPERGHHLGEARRCPPRPPRGPARRRRRRPRRGPPAAGSPRSCRSRCRRSAPPAARLQPASLRVSARNVRRYCCGLVPRAWPKWWRSPAAVPKPDSRATRSTGSVGGLEQLLGQQQPLVGHPLVRRGSRLGPEPAGEGALRQPARAARRATDRSSPGARSPTPAPARGSPRRSRAPGSGCTAPARRRGAAAPPSAGRPPRRPGAVASRIRCRQASIPAAVPALVTTGPSVDVQHVGVDQRAGEARGELVGVAPVGGARRPSSSPASPRAKAPTHSDSTWAPRSTAATSTSVTASRVGRAAEDCRYDHQVGLCRPVEAVRHVEVEPGGGTDRPRPRRTHREAGHRHAVVGAVDAERLADHPELERRDAVGHQHGHVTELIATASRIFGRNSMHSVLSATGGGMSMRRRITAMTIFFALLAIGAVVAATALRLVRLIRSDGYGHRPPPRSHWSRGSAQPPVSFSRSACSASSEASAPRPPVRRGGWRPVLLAAAAASARRSARLVAVSCRRPDRPPRRCRVGVSHRCRCSVSVE